jgi:flagellum-specific ATP synthase
MMLSCLDTARHLLEAHTTQNNLRETASSFGSTPHYQEVGRVEDITGLVIQTRGPSARIGDVCEIRDIQTQSLLVKAEVVGFKDGKLQLMPFGDLEQLAIGSLVINTHHALSIPVSHGLCGRVLDALGNPLDNLGPITALETRSLLSTPPDAMRRDRIDTILPLGVRALDAFLTMGHGQRMGIFAGSGVGKSTLQGMIARNTQANINVIALIGERGREVREFIEEALGEDGLSRSVVIVATSEQPPVLKIKAALAATTIAEWFRDQGANVMFMLDSVTRIAMALREVGLAVGEPPSSRGYTPSVFTFLPKLLERCGTSEKGSITGLYTVLVEGDDFNEPIADTVRGILDGHIVLSRELAHQNHFPAIDILSSVSRLMHGLSEDEHRQSAGLVRDLLATYKRAEDIISIGAYTPGANAKLDQAVQLKPAIDSFLKQDVNDNEPFQDTLSQLYQLAPP